ncbi:MAG: hypothetical protein ACK5T1_13145, partial [Betaproteobacteria bacterium]
MNTRSFGPAVPLRAPPIAMVPPTLALPAAAAAAGAPPVPASLAAAPGALATRGGGAGGKLVKLVPDNADILADYADSLAMARGRQLAGEPMALIAKALKLDPT